MSDFINLELVQALNPLYAFPIVAVILCAFIVYAFGFKSPVQPPSFDGIEEEKKIPKKRKSKESSKGKVVQNGKLNGSTSTKAQVSLPTKKKEIEKPAVIEKQAVEKPAKDQKVKKSKQSNEKKPNQEKKKESFSHEDTGEDGWVQLISKKGRKNRKKDEVGANENQVNVAKPEKNSQMKKSEEIIPSEESIKVDVTVEVTIPEKKDFVKEEKDVPQNEEIISEKPTREELKDIVNSYENLESGKLNDVSSEKAASKKNTPKGGKSGEEANKKSKKKKSSEVKNTDGENKTIISLTPAEHVISEPPAPQNTNNSTPVITEAVETTAGKVEENQPKETKSSNVVFDELAGLYPEPKESKKKKKVRRDH